MSADTLVLEIFDLSKIDECRKKAITNLLNDINNSDFRIDFLPLVDSGYNIKQVNYRYKMYRYWINKQLRIFRKSKIKNTGIIEEIISISENRSCYHFEGNYYLSIENFNGNILFRMNSSYNKLLHSYDETCSFLQKFENNISSFKNLPNYDEILKFWKYHEDRLIYVE